MRINPSCDRTARWSGLLSAVLLAFALLWNPQIAGAEYREVEVKNGGMITGKVSFRGELPQDAVENFPVSGRWPGCGTGYRKIVTIDVKDAALRGVFVLLDGITAGKKWPEPNSVAELDQKHCKFVPTHQVVRRGASMIIRNSDTGVLHNVNLREIIEVAGGRESRRMMFTIAQPVVGEIEKKIKPQKSPFIVVGCDLHYFMSAHVVAPEHPYAALVNEDGTYLFDDVPPGVHSAMAWHPRLGKKKVSVTVPANGTVEANFEFGE